MKRASVIGGSLGGLFAANLLHRAGWDVHVFGIGINWMRFESGMAVPLFKD